MTHKQEPPFAVQIELCEGCNLYCNFCGLQGIRHKSTKNFKFMKASTLVQLMQQITEAGWNPRIEFAMHGEPTMHPDLHLMIAAARTSAPSLHMMMTSNGGGLLKKPGPAKNVEELFVAGLNTLALDDYDGIGIVPKIREAWDHYQTICDTMVKTYEYPSDPKGSPHMRRPVNSRTLVFIEDISRATKGNHSLLNNHAGAGAPLDHSLMGKRCAKPFRELSVRWDGNVAVCCNDWRGVYKCGNIVTDGLLAVWNGDPINAARTKLYHGQRDFGPCHGCNAVSYRTGLLPDKKGRVELPKPNKSTAALLQQAMAGEPYTAPVLRPWEKLET